MKWLKWLLDRLLGLDHEPVLNHEETKETVVYPDICPQCGGELSTISSQEVQSGKSMGTFVKDYNVWGCEKCHWEIGERTYTGGYWDH